MLLLHDDVSNGSAKNFTHFAEETAELDTSPQKIDSVCANDGEWHVNSVPFGFMVCSVFVVPYGNDKPKL